MTTNKGVRKKLAYAILSVKKSDGVNLLNVNKISVFCTDI